MPRTLTAASRRGHPCTSPRHPPRRPRLAFLNTHAGELHPCLEPVTGSPERSGNSQAPHVLAFPGRVSTSLLSLQPQPTRLPHTFTPWDDRHFRCSMPLGRLKLSARTFPPLLCGSASFSWPTSKATGSQGPWELIPKSQGLGDGA